MRIINPPLAFILCLSAFITIGTCANAQDSIRYSTKILKFRLEKEHLKPKPFDDKLSQAVFWKTLYLLDPKGLLFTQDELNKLLPYQFLIDDECNNVSWNFIPFLRKEWLNSLNRAKKIVANLETEAFDFSGNEKVRIAMEDTLVPAKDEVALKLRWKNSLKYQTLERLVEQESQNTGAEHIIIQKRLLKKWQSRLEDIISNKSERESTIMTSFFNAITSYFDPHSLHFSPQAGQAFEESLSFEKGTYGLTIEQNAEGEMQINRILSGSSAWQSNQIHKGDVIDEIKLPDNTTIKVEDLDVDEMADLLENNKQLELVLKSPSGLDKSVVLEKTSVRNEELLVQSYILTEGQKIGYISLPDFYTQWDESGNLAQGCANDVAKEILKLKKEGIEGLILDLRNNGGGSVREGANLAGIFIDEGPLCFYSNAKAKTQTLKDFNRGTIFDEPLLVLVNGSSASASEILAGTLQDYGRAIIVGSTTFGKASMQRFSTLDSTEVDQNEPKSGFLTITDGKFYRLNGLTAQAKGIVPDIYLPSFEEGLAESEIAYKYVLLSDSVSKRMNYIANSNIPKAFLTNLSKERVSKSTSFESFKNINQTLKSKIKVKEIVLNYELFKKDYDEIQRLSLAIEQPILTTNKLTIKVTNAAEMLGKVDDFVKETFERNITQLQKDVWVNESFQILCDWLKNK